MTYHKDTPSDGVQEEGVNEHRPALAPEASVAFQVRRAHLAFERMMTVRLSKHGVKAGYYNYLRALWIREGVTQKELSDATRVTETTTVAMLKGMANEGLIDRVRDEVDQRKIVVTLTELGKSLEPALMPYAIEINGIATRGISPAQVETFLAVARQIARNLEKAFNPAA